MLDTDLLRDFAQATFEKQEAEKIVKARKRKIDELDEPIRTMFTEEGVPSSKITVQARDVDFDFAQFLHSFYNEAKTSCDAGEFESYVESYTKQAREEGLLAPSTPEYTKTIFVGSRVWAKPVATGVDEHGDPKVSEEDYERACEALRANGFGEYVQTRFNIVSLSSAVKEDVENGVIPTGTDHFDGAIEVAEKFQVQTRSAKK